MKVSLETACIYVKGISLVTTYPKGKVKFVAGLLLLTVYARVLRIFGFPLLRLAVRARAALPLESYRLSSLHLNCNVGMLN